jgi:Acetyltransferase (GNAT) domain
MPRFHQIESPPAGSGLESLPDRTIYQTPEWIAFLAETQGATPVYAELRDGSSVLGHLTGLTFSRFGLRIFGSPFPGWTTMYMGFNLRAEVPRSVALAAAPPFVFGDLGCAHFELADRYLSLEDAGDLENGFVESYETDLKQSEDEIFASMESACRRCIRKAEKSGVVIEEAADENFAGEYYEQLKDVFLKQGLVPTYDIERVRSLIRHLLPTGRLLLLRARDPDGACIGTGIYPGMNRIAQFWGNASFRASQNLRPNEALHWYAMRYWKKQGVEFFDWGGGGEYKEKYGCRKILTPWFHKSRFRIIKQLRDEAQRMFSLKQRFEGWLRSRGTNA